MVDGSAVAANGRSLAVAVAVVVLLTAGAGPAVGTTGPGTGADVTDDRTTLDPDEVEADRTVITIRLLENGTAAWSIEYFVALETREDERAWEDLENDVEANTSDYLTRFSDRIDSTVATAENETERTMSAGNYGVETRTEPQFGVLEYTFLWRGFAVVDGEEISAGDAIDGFLLDSDTRMVMQWPESYTATGVEPTADTDRDNAVVWRGSETEFVGGEPRVVVSAASDATTQPADPGTTATGGGTTAGEGTSPNAGTAGPTDEGGSDLPVALLGGLLALLVVVALSLYGYRQREGPLTDAGGGTDGGDGGDGGDDGGADAGAGGVAAAGAGAGGDGEEAVPDEELLSNEERVLKLVRENGGRMKQQEVVDELGWTEAKTSQVVRGLREENELEGFRLGRENVLKLPGEDDEI